MAFLNPSRYDAHKFEGESNSLPSLTEPDQTLSLQELFDRYRRNAPLSLSGHDVYYDDDRNFDDFFSELDEISPFNKPDVDLQELEDFKDTLKAYHNDVKKRFNKAYNDRKQSLIDKARDDDRKSFKSSENIQKDDNG